MTPVGQIEIIIAGGDALAIEQTQTSIQPLINAGYVDKVHTLPSASPLGWEVYAQAEALATPYFVWLNAGERFVWPWPLFAADIMSGAILLSQKAEDAQTYVELAPWLSGQRVPLALGGQRSTPVWSTALARRAGLLLRSMHGAKLSRLSQWGATPWMAYLATNEDRLGAYHKRIVV